MQCGANPRVKDNDGHNVIHIAAQGDQVATIYYYKNRYKFDLDDRDVRDSTALHWAAYLNKEVALAFLIAWGADVNSTDFQNNTPLHLSVVACGRVNESRCVKILLLKGAQRDKANMQGKLPVDLVKESPVRDELISILQNPSYCTCLMLKVPLTKMSQSWSTAIFFIFLLIFIKGGSALFILPLVEREYLNYFMIASGSLFFLTMVFYLMATFKNPGYLKTSPNINFQQLLSETDPYNICADCQVIRTPRSRH